MLTALAASGHLAHDAVCFISLLSPCLSTLAGAADFFFLTGPEQALGDPEDEKRPKRKENIYV